MSRTSKPSKPPKVRKIGTVEFLPRVHGEVDTHGIRMQVGVIETVDGAGCAIIQWKKIPVEFFTQGGVTILNIREMPKA